ncbi:MAG: secondary thiamine-phosphate synthase enzyme YjbQ [Candidatus Krumholzibacteria bacterium]|nr:secondary thiamine-phosphate synthase enzyme YjbQ [Candidatus Krumholzibacteria bacterium]
MREITLQTGARTDFVDLTNEVQTAVSDLGLQEGVVVVFNPHTTAAVTINEGADPDVVTDMAAALDRVVPWQDGYLHAEGNAAAHIKASMFGSSVTVIVAGGRLKLGTWQKIWFCDFDGPRRRRIWVRSLSADS